MSFTLSRQLTALRQISCHGNLSYRRACNEMSLMILPFLLSPGSSPLLDPVPPWQSGGKDGLRGSLRGFSGPGRGTMLKQGYLVNILLK